MCASRIAREESTVTICSARQAIALIWLLQSVIDIAGDSPRELSVEGDGGGVVLFMREATVSVLSPP